MNDHAHFAVADVDTNDDAGFLDNYGPLMNDLQIAVADAGAGQVANAAPLLDDQSDDESEDQ